MQSEALRKGTQKSAEASRGRRIQFLAEYDRVSDFMDWSGMAEHFDVTVPALKQKLRKAGVDVDTPAKAFIEDYSFLRANNVPHEKIAERIGIKLDSLLKSVRRNDCEIPETGWAEARTIVDRLIETGREFTTEGLPESYPDRIVDGQLKKRMSEGRVVKVGRISSMYMHGNMVPVYRGVGSE